jgi:anti-sigma factor RsiW
MTQEQLEFAITQYLDGTLPAEDVGALERRLGEDAGARALLEEHRKLTEMLRAEPGPALAWDEVASDLRAVVTGTVDHEARAADQKLNGLLKSAVGPVPAVRWDALAVQISGSIDREVAFRDEHDDALDEALRALPTPDLNWERLAAHLSGAVAKEAQKVVEPSVRERVYSLKWVRRASQMALAACLVIGAAVGIRAYLRPTATTVQPTGPVVAKIEIGGPERATATAVAQVKIGPSEEYVKLAEERELYGQGVASGRGPIVIALPVSVSEDLDRGYGMFE